MMFPCIGRNLIPQPAEPRKLPQTQIEKAQGMLVVQICSLAQKPTVENVKQVGRGRVLARIKPEKFHGGRIDSDKKGRACLMAADGQVAVLQINLAKVGKVDEGHAMKTEHKLQTGSRPVEVAGGTAGSGNGFRSFCCVGTPGCSRSLILIIIRSR